MITVSYNGVHQAYQLALAAQEADLLGRFLCSIYDGPGMWGRRLSKMLGTDSLRNRRLDGLHPDRVVEYPWPELRFKLASKIRKLPGNAWITAAHTFDTWAAKQIEAGSSQVIVCVENCAFQTFQVAERRGLRRIYDCPGHNAEMLRATTQEAARRTGLPFVSVADTPGITRRKARELALADVVLTYSDFHSEGIRARGVPHTKIVQIPLWTDPDFWRPPERPRKRTGLLSVLFAGGINLRKGIPFLVDAVKLLEPHAKLTLVGTLDPDVKSHLAGCDSFVSILPPVDKYVLRDIYQRHDLLVLPSLGDSFGFVAMEAMACGLPVILTTHCGAPVPEDSWKVPVMDSDAIFERLKLYLDDGCQLTKDGQLARAFAMRFTPSRYRQQIKKLFETI